MDNALSIIILLLVSLGFGFAIALGITKISQKGASNGNYDLTKYYLWLLPIRNTVNTRLFGAYKSEKIIFDLSHYAKSRPAWKTGGFFAWIDGKEAQK